MHPRRSLVGLHAAKSLHNEQEDQEVSSSRRLHSRCQVRSDVEKPALFRMLTIHAYQGKTNGKAKLARMLARMLASRLGEV
eukprot:scaffold63_cov306-Pinguiococcus_pyrenoidosus.AAC.20